MSELTQAEVTTMSPKEFRQFVRRKEWIRRTEFVCRGYVQANLAIVPKEYAFDFLLFCNRNPRPCPLLDVTEPGDPRPKLMAPEADLRTDLPKYCVYENGKLVAEPTDVTNYWRDDLVSFLLGCSFSFEWALQAANVRSRLIGTYIGNIRCVPAGRFSGPMAISCRLIKGSHDAVRAVQISSRYTAAHGPPVHIGDPRLIGIKDIMHSAVWTPDYPVPPQERDEIPMFWGCGVTPQMVALESRLPLMIAHCPGHMFITDRLGEEMAVT